VHVGHARHAANLSIAWNEPAGSDPAHHSPSARWRWSPARCQRRRRSRRRPTHRCWGHRCASVGNGEATVATQVLIIACRMAHCCTSLSDAHHPFAKRTYLHTLQRVPARHCAPRSTRTSAGCARSMRRRSGRRQRMSWRPTVRRWWLRNARSAPCWRSGRRSPYRRPREAECGNQPRPCP
jgi:hypothetical protein